MFPSIKENIRMGALEINVLLDGDDTAGSLMVFELIVPAAAKVPAPHFHTAVDETIYMLEGTLTQIHGAETLTLNAGDKCFISKGTVHGFNNLHAGTARALCILSPASIGPAYFREIGAVINAGGPPDMVKVLAIMQQHGLEPAKPAN